MRNPTPDTGLADPAFDAELRRLEDELECYFPAGRAQMERVIAEAVRHSHAVPTVPPRPNYSLAQIEAERERRPRLAASR